MARLIQAGRADDPLHLMHKPSRNHYSSSRMLKSPPDSFSLRSEAQRTEAYASPLRSLRPCLGQGASRRARVGRVRSLNCLSILWNGTPVVLHMWTTEVLLCQNGLQYPVNNTRAHRRILDRKMVIVASPRRVGT
jgi:hypothetical protein